MHQLIAVGLFVVVLALVITQPRGLSIGWTAGVGGAAAILTGVVSWANVLEVVRIVWDATFTFVGLIVISLVLDKIGLFKWAALHMAAHARGSGLRLFFLLAALGALVAMFFANDGAALILTPIVYELTRTLELDPKPTLALIMASGFIADTTSIPLVISNLVNIVSADFFHLGFVSYAARMLPVDGVAFLASVGALYLLYRRDLRIPIASAGLPAPMTAIRDPRLFRRVWVVLALLLAGYLASQALHWPVSVITAAATAALLLVARRSPALKVRTLLQEAPWKIVVFSIGMYVVVFGLRNAGLTHLVGQLLTGWAHWGLGASIVGTGITAAVFSSIMNNMPTVMINALALADAPLAPGYLNGMAYANVIGCDLGPKLTPIGSLATLLWLHVLDLRGVTIGWGYYMRTGAVLTLPVLLVTLLSLWGWTAIAPRLGG